MIFLEMLKCKITDTYSHTEQRNPRLYQGIIHLLEEKSWCYGQYLKSFLFAIKIIFCIS